MTYKTPSELLRLQETKKWVLNLSAHNYKKLGTLLQLKYYLTAVLKKKKIIIIQLKGCIKQGKVSFVIYYYKYTLANILLDKIIKKKIERDAELLFGTPVCVDIFNIINFLPSEVNELHDKLKSYVSQPKRNPFLRDLVYLVNISTYIHSTNVLAVFLLDTLCSLKKQWFFIKITHRLLKQVLSYRSETVSGIKLAIAGKINGRSRKKTIFKIFGDISTQSLNRNIKFSLATGYNVFGAFSVKLWFTGASLKI